MKTLRFKQGDLAIIIRAAQPEMVGRVVEIEAVGPFAPLERVRTRSHGTVSCLGYFDYVVSADRDGLRGYGLFSDERLMPLKGDDAEFRREQATDRPREQVRA